VALPIGVPGAYQHLTDEATPIVRHCCWPRDHNSCNWSTPAGSRAAVMPGRARGSADRSRGTLPRCAAWRRPRLAPARHRVMAPTQVRQGEV